MHRFFKSGVFFFRDRKFPSIRQGKLKAADGANVTGIYKIAFMAAYEKLRVLFFESSSRDVCPESTIVCVKHGVSAVIDALGIDDGVRDQIEISRVRAAE